MKSGTPSFPLVLFILVFLLQIAASEQDRPVSWRDLPHMRLYRRVVNETTIRRRRLSDFFYTAPTAGETRILGYFYALVYIGSPAQRTTLIVDTGSVLCATPCSTCKDCGNHLNPSFDPKKSKTIQPVDCDKKPNHMTCSSCKNGQCYFVQRYLEGSSLTGPVYRDHMWLGGNVLVNNSKIPVGDEYSLIHYSILHSFGCSEKVTGLFSSQLADGIIGLAPRANSYITNLFSQRSTLYKSFSLCFEDDGGLIVFGGHDYRLDSTPMCYTKLYVSTGYYRIMIEDVTWNEVKAVDQVSYWNREMGVLVDSGTSFTYVYAKAFYKLMQVFKTESKKMNAPLHLEQRVSGETACYRISEKDISLFPTLYLTFQSGCRYHISPHDYFFYKTKFNVYCMGIYSDPSTVIGNNIMNNHHFYFDLRQNLLGISEAKCSTPANRKQDFYDLTTKYSQKASTYHPHSSQDAAEKEEQEGTKDKAPLQNSASKDSGTPKEPFIPTLVNTTKVVPKETVQTIYKPNSTVLSTSLVVKNETLPAISKNLTVLYDPLHSLVVQGQWSNSTFLPPRLYALTLIPSSVNQTEFNGSTMWTSFSSSLSFYIPFSTSLVYTNDSSLLIYVPPVVVDLSVSTLLTTPLTSFPLCVLFMVVFYCVFYYFMFLYNDRTQ